VRGLRRPPFMLSRRAGSRERSCYPTPCGTPCRHAWAAGDANREPRRAAARHRSVDGRDDHDPWTDRGSAPVGRRAHPRSPGERARALASRGHSDDRMRRRVVHGRRRNADGLRPFVRAGRTHGHHKARGNGHQDRARRRNEFRVVAKRVRKMRSDQIRLREQERYAHAMGNMQRGPCPERGHEPPHDGRPDAFGDQGVQESGHRRPGHTSLECAAGHVARWFYARRHDVAPPGRHPFGLSTPGSTWREGPVGAAACRPTSDQVVGAGLRLASGRAAARRQEQVF
jgi:hypothetical protein